MKHVHHGSIQEASRIYLEQKKVAMRDVYNARKCQAPVAEASEALWPPLRLLMSEPRLS